MLPFSLRNLIGTFWGAKLNMCVGKAGGGRKRRGGPIRISAGLLCWYLFLVVSFLFFLLLWARFAGAACNFLLVFGYVSVGIYLQS